MEKKFFNTKVMGVLVIILLVALIALGLYIKFNLDDKSTKVGFEDIGELATQESICTEVEVTDDPRELFGFDIPFTTSKLIYSYDIIVKAGIDFEKIEYDVNEKKKEIEVKLPKFKILSKELDLDSFEVYHEDESIFNNITLEKNNETFKKLEKKAVKSAKDNGILEKAEENAKIILKGYFAQAYDLDEYKINFKVKD